MKLELKKILDGMAVQGCSNIFGVYCDKIGRMSQEEAECLEVANCRLYSNGILICPTEQVS